MNAPSTVERLAYFQPETPAPAPSPARGRVDAACSSRATAKPAPPLRGGPEREHRIHWRYVVRAGRLEVRLTTYNGKLEIRPWFRTRDAPGGWFPTTATRLVSIDDREVADFTKALAEAAAAISGETKGKS